MFDLLQCSRSDSQISISARMFEGSRLNNDACMYLSHFLGCCTIAVR